MRFRNAILAMIGKPNHTRVRYRRNRVHLAPESAPNHAGVQFLGTGARMAQPEPGDVTRLLQSWSRGDEKALEAVVPLVYRELRRLAAAYIRRERRDHTL